MLLRASFHGGNKEGAKGSSKLYEGVAITIPVLAGPSGDAVKTLAPDFEAISGMKVNIEILSHDELWKKMELDAASKAGNFDAYHINYFKLDEYRITAPSFR